MRAQGTASGGLHAFPRASSEPSESRQPGPEQETCTEGQIEPSLGSPEDLRLGSSVFLQPDMACPSRLILDVQEVDGVSHCSAQECPPSQAREASAPRGLPLSVRPMRGDQLEPEALPGLARPGLTPRAGLQPPGDQRPLPRAPRGVAFAHQPASAT